MEVKVNRSILQLAQGDITKQDTQAVVNAANSRLAPGGGVAGAIHRAAGAQLWQECKTLGGCLTGEAKITRGYNLPNQYVIHTVGPVYGSGGDDGQMLKNSYLNSLRVAEENKIESIAFPAISTGAFGYPAEGAARIALSTILEYLGGKTEIKLVKLILYDSRSLAVHSGILKEIT
ncbi:MAG: macro domain-containing protein [Candidatus Omnitrophica bacterium]|nr:macro domain-containing protein [Candidatus Omnitrophota bacterium]